MTRRYWTAEDLATLRGCYGRVPTRELAARLGRTVPVLHRAASKYHATFQSRAVIDHGFDGRLRSLNAEGYSDTEAATLLNCERHTASRRRRALGLPSHAHGERARTKTREAMLRQCAAADVPTLGMVRAKAYRDFATENGWPADLRPRAVQILNALAAAGVPLSRPQIAEAVGMPWKGSRKSLVSNDPEGSYLAHLAARGLVARLSRALPVRGQGRGRTRDLYCLGPAALAILAERASQSQGEVS